MFEKIKFKTSNTANKMRAAYAAATVAGMATTMPAVFAVDQTADAMVGKLVGIICTIFRYIGILLAVWAVGMLVLAFKNEDADSKSRSMMLLIVSIVLIVIKSIVQMLLDVSGTGITIS